MKIKFEWFEKFYLLFQHHQWEEILFLYYFNRLFKNVVKEKNVSIYLSNVYKFLPSQPWFSCYYLCKNVPYKVLFMNLFRFWKSIWSYLIEALCFHSSFYGLLELCGERDLSKLNKSIVAAAGIHWTRINWEEKLPKRSAYLTPLVNYDFFLCLKRFFFVCSEMYLGCKSTNQYVGCPLDENGFKIVICK